MGLGALWMGAKLIGGRMAGNAKRDWQALSPRTKLIIFGVVVLVVFFFVHRHMVHKALDTAYKSGYEQRGKDDEAQMKKLLAQLNAKTAVIATDERKKNAEAHATVDRRADAVFVRGPGKAICPNGAGPAGPAIRPAASGQTVSVDGEVAGVPGPGGQQLIALPFADAVSFARSYDSCQVDKGSWESLYRRVEQVWPK